MIERYKGEPGYVDKTTTYERAEKEYVIVVSHIKLDADGNKLRENNETLKYNLWDKLSKKEWWAVSEASVQQTPDMGYIIGGSLYNNQVGDYDATAGTATSGNRAFFIKIQYVNN